MTRPARTIRKSAQRVVGKALRDALGFRSERSFQRAHRDGLVGVKLYPMPSPSRGFYARSDELEWYLAKRLAGSVGPGERTP